MDLRMAQQFGLNVHLARNRDCGKFGVPRSGIEHDYAGVVVDPFELKLGPKVAFVISGMRVLSHPTPLFLIGADVLCGGRSPPSWNFGGADITTEPATGEVQGAFRFTRGVEQEIVPLA